MKITGAAFRKETKMDLSPFRRVCKIFANYRLPLYLETAYNIFWSETQF